MRNPGKNMRYKGIVTNNADPEKRGRIKVMAQEIVGAGQELPFWIEPDMQFLSKDGGCFFFVPEIDTVVDLIELVGDESLGEYSEVYLLTGRYLYRGTQFSPKTVLPEVFKENYPKRRGFCSPSGHYMIFDDVSGEVIISRSGTDAQITFTSDGKMQINGVEVLINANGNINIAGTNISVIGSGTVKVHGANVMIDQNADEHLVRGESLKSWLENTVVTIFNAHTHLYLPGPGSATPCRRG